MLLPALVGRRLSVSYLEVRSVPTTSRRVYPSGRFTRTWGSARSFRSRAAIARCRLIGRPDTARRVPTAVRTTAVRSGDTYVLNGRKQWITNGERARYGIVYARAEGGITAFLVDGDASGLSTSPIPVLRDHWPTEMVLDDVVVPAANRIGCHSHQLLIRLRA